jgi:hypothetical protein
MGQLDSASSKAHAYGYLEYDVPKERQSVYNRLRDRLRRISIMRTWSVYLVRLEYRDQVLAILKDLDADEDKKQRILYDFTKIDPSESEKIDKWVQQQFKATVKRAKDELHQKLGEAERMFDDGDLIVKDKALLQRAHLSKAMKKVNEARRLSHVFDVTEVMEAAFAAFEKLVAARRLKIKQEVEAEEKRKKAEAAKDEKAKAQAAA